ncbi:MAG: hypothetical protein HOE90_06765 [Bacteriovoracaceae bacterium]|jgi:hypothetical protein|nr:hypothetical protein [Bacteriovoracaceae bacterium]
MIKWILILYFTLPTPGISSTIFVPDSDTALLIELVSTTISQLNELEKLVSNAEKYTKRIQEYNELAEDYYFRAQRLLYWADDMLILLDSDVKSLEQLNSAIRSLRFQIDDFKSQMMEYGLIAVQSEKEEFHAKANSPKIKRRMRLAKLQLDRSSGVKSSKGALKQINQNTALINSSVVDLNAQTNSLVAINAKRNRMIAKDMTKKAIKNQKKKEFYQLDAISPKAAR